MGDAYFLENEQDYFQATPFIAKSYLNGACPSLPKTCTFLGDGRRQGAKILEDSVTFVYWLGLLKNQ